MRIRDPGWKKFGSGINIPDPQHWQEEVEIFFIVSGNNLPTIDIYQKKIQKECTDLWRKGGSSSSACEHSELSWLSSSSFFGFSRKEQANFPTKSRKDMKYFLDFRKKWDILLKVGVRIRIGSEFNWVRGTGSRQAKTVSHKNNKNLCLTSSLWGRWKSENSTYLHDGLNHT
jgi:hypothetical protein